jgi:putative membrane protein
MYFNYNFLGINLIWWIMWLFVLLFFVYFFVPFYKKNKKNTPLDILQRKVSTGDISIEEYEKGKRILELEHDMKIRMYLISNP